MPRARSDEQKERSTKKEERKKNLGGCRLPPARASAVGGAFKVWEEFGNRVFDFQIGDNGEERERVEGGVVFIKDLGATG